MSILSQAEKSLEFLQHLAKGGKLPGLGTRGTHQGRKVPPDGIRTGTTSVMFRARLPKRESKGRQSFLPHDDGTFSAVKLHLSSKELLLQLNDHRKTRRRGPIPINKQMPASRVRTKPR
jgi:hypothetical protein